MAAQIYVEHGNEAEFSKYPFSGRASMLDTGGRAFPDGFVIDAVLYPKGGSCRLLSTESDGTKCTAAVAYDGGEAVGSFVSGDASFELHDSDGFHVGTIVLGPNSPSYVSEIGTRVFNDMPFCVSCQYPVGEYGVTSVSVDGGGTKLRGTLSFTWPEVRPSRVEAVVGYENGEATLRFDVVPSGSVLAGESGGIRTIYICRQPGSRFGIMRRGDHGERPYLYLTKDGFFRQNSLLGRSLICANSDRVSSDYDKRSSYDDCGAAGMGASGDAAQKVQEQSSWANGKSGYCFHWTYSGSDPIRLYEFYHDVDIGHGFGTRETVDEAVSGGWVTPPLDMDLYNSQQFSMPYGRVMKPMSASDRRNYLKLVDLFAEDREYLKRKYIEERTEENHGIRPTVSLGWRLGGPGWWWDYPNAGYLPTAMSVFGFTRLSTTACYFIEESIYASAYVSDRDSRIQLNIKWHRTSDASRFFGYPIVDMYDSEDDFPKESSTYGAPIYGHSMEAGRHRFIGSRLTGKVYENAVRNGVIQRGEYEQVADGYSEGRGYALDPNLWRANYGNLTYDTYPYSPISLRWDKFEEFYDCFFAESGEASKPGKIGYLNYRKLFELCLQRGWIYGSWIRYDDQGWDPDKALPAYYHDGVMYDDQEFTQITLPKPGIVYRDVATGGLYLWYTGISDDDPMLNKGPTDRAKLRENLLQELKTAFQGVDLTKINLLYINRTRDFFEHFGCKNWEIGEEGHLGETMRYLVNWGKGSEFWSGGCSYLTFNNTAGKEIYVPKWIVARYVWWKKYCRTGDLRYRDAAGPDVVRAYKNGNFFYTRNDDTSDAYFINPDENKLYIDLNTNFAYTWGGVGGSGFVRKDWMRYFIVPPERGVCLYVGDYFRDGIRDHGKEQSMGGWDCVDTIDSSFWMSGSFDPRDAGLGFGGYSINYNSLYDPSINRATRRLYEDELPGYDPTDPDGEGPDKLFSTLGEYGAGDVDEDNTQLLDRMDDLVKDEFASWDRRHPFSDQTIMQPDSAPVSSNMLTFWETGGNVYDEHRGFMGPGPFEYKYGRIYIEGRGYPDDDDPEGQELERELLDNKSMYFFKFDLTKSVGNSFNFDTTDMTTTDAVYDNPIHISIEPSTEAPRSVNVENPTDVVDVTKELRKLTNRSTTGNGISISIPGLE